MIILILEDVVLDVFQPKNKKEVQVHAKKDVLLRVDKIGVASGFDGKKSSHFHMDDLFENESTFLISNDLFRVVESDEVVDPDADYEKIFNKLTERKTDEMASVLLQLSDDEWKNLNEEKKVRARKAIDHLKGVFG